MAVIFSPQNAANGTPRRFWSIGGKANGHGAFDDDEDTMTSVLLRIMGTKDLASVIRYPKGGMPSGH